MLELTILLIGISIILLILYFRRLNTNTLEHYSDFYLSSCPSGYKTFYNNDGDINCCNGEIVGNKCAGEHQCTLGKGTPNLPNCIVSIMEDYSKKGKEFCFKGMSNYFEDNLKNIKGCTDGPLNSSLNGPRESKEPYCIYYTEWKDNINSKDSCFNQRQLAMTQCIGNNCTKEVMQPSPGGPVIVAVGFTDDTGIHRIAYTKETLQNFLDYSNPKWREQGMDLDKNIAVLDVAKAYYIDKTMSQADVQF